MIFPMFVRYWAHQLGREAPYVVIPEGRLPQHGLGLATCSSHYRKERPLLEGKLTYCNVRLTFSDFKDSMATLGQTGEWKPAIFESRRVLAEIAGFDPPRLLIDSTYRRQTEGENKVTSKYSSTMAHYTLSSINPATL